MSCDCRRSGGCLRRICSRSLRSPFAATDSASQHGGRGHDDEYDDDNDRGHEQNDYDDFEDEREPHHDHTEEGD